MRIGFALVESSDLHTNVEPDSLKRLAFAKSKVAKQRPAQLKCSNVYRF
jgi:hypothetical protein